MAAPMGGNEDPIEADATSDYASDTDSVRSDLTSVGSSVFNYEYENGRRYHAYRAGKYILPNDEDEQNRLDLMHHVFGLALDGDICLTKLNSPLNILDIGTGTGLWAIDAGDSYPMAKVVGTDVSPIQPNWLPPNVHFQVDDVTDEWAFPQNHFDFIHIRCLGGAIRDWPALLRTAYAHLKPGGKIELSEGRTHLCCDDGTYSTESETYRWVSEFHKIARANGLEFDPFDSMPGWLREGGFTNVTATEFPCPIGSWPKNKKLKNIGRFFKHQFITYAVDSYSLALFTRIGGWTEAETLVLLAGVRNEFNTNSMHVYTHCSYALGEKPRN